jgi:AcrR family transcriptional regulator
VSRPTQVDGVAERPATRRARRGRPPLISQDRIVDAAVELGLDAFSMQGIAEHLGVTTPALYSHVGGRDEVLALVNAELLRRMTDVASTADNWRNWLADFAAEVRDHLAPSASALMVDLRGPATTVRLGVGERGLRLLLDAGLTPTQAGRAVWLVFRTALTGGGVQGAAALAGFVDDTGAVLGPGPSGAFPATRTVHAALAADGTDDTFAFDLQVVLDGIARQLGTDAPASHSPRRSP